MIRSLNIVLVIIAALMVAAPAVAASTEKQPAEPSWADEPLGYGDPRKPVLDLSDYRLTWSDEFNSLSSITRNTGPGPWRSNVMAGVFGLAETVDIADTRFPGIYTQANGILTLRAAKMYLDATGQTTINPGTAAAPNRPVNNGRGVQRWVGGFIQTVDERGHGFAQQYGYFEARLKLPSTCGAWPAFWLKGTEKWTTKDRRTTEIDVIEHYPCDNAGAHHTLHLWPAPEPRRGAPNDHWMKSDYYGVKDAAGEPIDLTQDWHTWGLLVTPEKITAYLDRRALASFPTLDEFKTPLYPMLDIAVWVQEDGTTQATSPVDLQIDYVRVYKAKDAAAAPSP